MTWSPEHSVCLPAGIRFLVSRLCWLSSEKSLHACRQPLRAAAAQGRSAGERARWQVMPRLSPRLLQPQRRPRCPSRLSTPSPSTPTASSLSMMVSLGLPSPLPAADHRLACDDSLAESMSGACRTHLFCCSNCDGRRDVTQLCIMIHVVRFAQTRQAGSRPSERGFV